MTWFLATMSGPDVAAAGCILAALSCLLLRHPFPIGLGAPLFALAATVGAALPVALTRLGFDPAVASGPFVTTSTDVLGILTFCLVAAALL